LLGHCGFHVITRFKIKPADCASACAVARNQRAEARRIGQRCIQRVEDSFGLAWCSEPFFLYRQSSSRSDHRSRCSFRRGSCCLFPPSLVLAVADASRIACCCALDLSFCTSACLQNSVVVGGVYADGWGEVIKDLKALLNFVHMSQPPHSLPPIHSTSDPLYMNFALALALALCSLSVECPRDCFI